jgi:cell division protein ZipA
MEADILRLILLIAGLGLVLGIFLWDRHQRGQRRAEREQRDHWHDQLGDDDTLDIDQELQSLDQLLHEGEQAGAQQVSPAVAGAAPQQDDLFGFSGGAAAGAPANERKRTKPAPAYRPPDPDLPVKIVQINLVAKGHKFEGNDILRAAYDTGLEAGDMNIFHRYPPGKQAGEAPVVFSMASMVEPGIFPLDDMSDFSTPGLTLFARLPGPMDGLAVFADLLFTAERLASILRGELQDDTHSHLTKQTIEHLREEILEHRRQLQLRQKKK